MINLEQYQNMKKNNDTIGGAMEMMEGGKREKDDILVKKKDEAWITKAEREKDRKRQEMDAFSERLKPLLSIHLQQIDDILKEIHPNRQAQAKFILEVLSRLPKVSLTKKHLLIDNEPQPGYMKDILEEMMDNNITGVTSIINALRSKMPQKKKVNQPPMLSLTTPEVTDESSTEYEGTTTQGYFTPECSPEIAA